MPPQKKFSVEQLINAAYNIALEDGIDGISIRKVASALGSSIAPIYVNFKDVQELKKEVVLKVIKMAEDITFEQNSENKFLNLGRAAILYARTSPKIFQDYVINAQGEYQNKEILDQFILNYIKDDELLQDFNDEELQEFIFKMKAFQNGVALLASDMQFSKKMDDPTLEALYVSAIEDMIDGIKRRKAI